MATVQPESTVPLLSNEVVESAVDYKGRPVNRSTSGGWKSASLIIGVEVAERFSYYGISSNLISYLTGPLGQSTAAAAANVNAWSGTASMLPLLGAFIADSFLGRYRTIVTASLIYILGLSLLTLSAVLPSLMGCQNTDKVMLCSSGRMQEILFFFSLYLVALAQGGHKPCVQAFGADQFDNLDPVECKAKSSFFNWWYFSLCFGSMITLLVLNYIQENLSWGLGFGIPCIAMVIALLVFLYGTKTYRYSIKRDEKSPFTRIGEVFVAAFKNRKTQPPAVTSGEAGITPSFMDSQQFRFLDNALLEHDNLEEQGKVINVNEVEEAKAILRLMPIWCTCLIYAVVFAQFSTFFTKQGTTMDRYIFPGYEVPAASLQSFISLAIVLFIPIYDRIFVPLSRSFTGKASGISMLQRIGVGMFISVLSMAVSALVEMKRLKTAKDYGLIDKPDTTVPMAVWWLVPQYILTGLADVFTMVGLQEFFYDQVPNDLKSMGLSLYLSIFGVGSFLSSFLVSTIDKATSGDGQYSWFADNLNRAHLDYYYWLLAGSNAIGLSIFIYFAKSSVYNKANTE